MRGQKDELASNRKEAEGVVAATSSAVSTETPVTDVQGSTPSTSLSKLGTPTASEPSSESCSPLGYAMIDLTVLASLFTAFHCLACGVGIQLITNPSSRRGFAHHFSLSCKVCGYFESSTMTSNTLESASRQRHYEVNRKMVLSFLEAGVGFAGLQTLCETMGMVGISQATYKDHLSDIHKATESAKKELMDKAESKIRAVHNTPTGDMDLTVSFDGSWQKRGHTSKHGIAAVIEATTGLIIDYHVMATLCQVSHFTSL
ncbi:hypothetical protein PoB_003038800 [Plakobranchus ocellatus]|uniref:Mutator-like transposase domain-containing protein n=1 Tax=Plakobranchus ocellatus TaxID=259542 RepID=A0AAV4ABA3_9GAST|nr:hypothetical protein PoB_003038800 [Plakobranchus ocellatus]